jgi:hypothetical protein
MSYLPSVGFERLAWTGLEVDVFLSVTGSVCVLLPMNYIVSHAKSAYTSFKKNEMYVITLYGRYIQQGQLVRKGAIDSNEL